uniref:Uncharacterized protein n=1 Tax=Eutreptiella gymnastica TaxID=73025 RepID=A0A6U8NR37_9EUGL
MDTELVTPSWGAEPDLGLVPEKGAGGCGGCAVPPARLVQRTVLRASPFAAHLPLNICSWLLAAHSRPLLLLACIMMSRATAVLNTSLVDLAVDTDSLCMLTAFPLGLRLVPVAFIVVLESTTVVHSSSSSLAMPACQQVIISMAQTVKYCSLPWCLP